MEFTLYVGYANTRNSCHTFWFDDALVCMQVTSSTSYLDSMPLSGSEVASLPQPVEPKIFLNLSYIFQSTLPIVLSFLYRSITMVESFFY